MLLGLKPAQVYRTNSLVTDDMAASWSHKSAASDHSGRGGVIRRRGSLS